ncbi:MAG: TolC family protein [Sulfurimicrobium sp.]|nr:TolC family protein [Sulfurimicrobium sp.]MDZ7655915.1 TolC family protein [Sulfurimicrobium sp.]
MKLRLIAAALATMAAHSTWAVEFKEYSDLPPQAMVQQVLQSYPSVLAAQSGIKVGEAARDRLEAGSHEFNVTLGAARRRVVENGDQLRDWNVGLERALRLPRKAGLDSALGQQGLVLTQNAYGDAMHEAGRKLLSGWFVWLRERAQLEQWQRQVDVLKQQLDVVTRRVKAGDAARLEEELAQAALMQAEISLQQARLRADNARVNLSRYFPTLALPAQPVAMAQRQAPEQDLAYWLDLGLDHNHELMLARAESKVAQLTAQRADADRMPDPSLGLHYLSERNGSENVTGVYVSMPLPGGARRAVSAESLARAEMAAQREALVQRRIEAEISAAYNSAKSAHASWQSASAASELMQRNEAKMARAYELGEMGLNDVLLARRQGMEARLAATLARFEAAETYYRLLLDTHQLWPLGSEEGEGHH